MGMNEQVYRLEIKYLYNTNRFPTQPHPVIYQEVTDFSMSPEHENISFKTDGVLLSYPCQDIESVKLTIPLKNQRK